MHSKKHLSFNALRSMIADKFVDIQDSRASNVSNSMADVMLSGLACMYVFPIRFIVIISEKHGKKTAT